ncbi:MAG: SAM-dependent methyltransferase, partial [Hyphomicrobiales bacterium]|nr:SAM-dependent methyltransferase [Hyphomicrobiales bacterium]
RNREALAALAAFFGARASLSIVDLACGAGSTMRAIGARLPPQQRWRLVDHDPDLLALVSPPTRGQQIATAVADIAGALETILAEPADLVTASALLDLVSAAWLDRLVAQCAARALPLYAALTYDGRISFAPIENLDAEMVAAVNRHQRRDKGFGAALGPSAGASAIARFATIGWRVVSGASDWELGPEDTAIQAELLAGWAAAASENGDLPQADIDAWLARRLRHVTQRRSSIRVGHVDVFAAPIGAR